MLTPSGFPAWCWFQARLRCWLLGHIPLFFYCLVLFWLSCVIFGIRANIDPHSQSKTIKITTKKKPSLLCLPPLESYLCHFPYLVPKSCPIVVLSIRRPDIQANQRLQSKNPQSSLQIPCDYKDREKGNKSAAIVPHYHQEATTFRFGQILSRQLLCMPPPPPPWAVASTGPHHHHFSFAQCHAATISSASIDPISWGNPLVLSKPILIY